MKILMLASGTIHSSLSHRLLSFARELVASGNQVTIIAPASDKYSKFEPDNAAVIDGVNLVYPRQFATGSYILNLVPYILSCALHVLRIKADVVYIYKPTPITVPGLMAKWFKRVPVVLDMDDLGSEVMKVEQQPKIIYELVAFCERLVAKNAKAIIAASTLLEREYHAEYPAKPIARISNGVDPAEFSVTPARKTPHIIFIGALNRTRIVQPLIDAIPAVIAASPGHTVQLDIHGDGAFRAHFEEEVKKLGVSSHVKFYGWTKHSDLPKYTAAADLGICAMPNDRTTSACSNQKLFEYMAMGLCVVGSNVGDLPNYLDHGKSGVIVDSLNSEQLAVALTGLLEDSAKRERLAAHARRQAETIYSWKTLAGNISRLLTTSVVTSTRGVK